MLLLLSSKTVLVCFFDCFDHRAAPLRRNNVIRTAVPCPERDPHQFGCPAFVTAAARCDRVLIASLMNLDAVVGATMLALAAALALPFLVDLNKMKDVAVGDEVLIEECKPLSKRKHFILKEVLKRVPRVSEMKEEKNVTDAMTRKSSESSDSSDSSVPSSK